MPKIPNICQNFLYIKLIFCTHNKNYHFYVEFFDKRKDKSYLRLIDGIRNDFYEVQKNASSFKNNGYFLLLLRKWKNL